MTIFRTLSFAALVVMLGAGPAYAQQPAAPADPHHPGGEKGPSTAPAPAAAPKPGMPMEMCRQMMGDMMAMPMMGGAMPADPKDRADMLQMRGEMMKAMGDVMMKHARRMQGTPAQ